MPKQEWKLFVWKESVREGRQIHLEDVKEILVLSSKDALEQRKRRRESNLQILDVEEHLEILYQCNHSITKLAQSGEYHLAKECDRLIVHFAELRLAHEFLRIVDANEEEFGNTITGADLIGFFSILSKQHILTLLASDFDRINHSLVYLLNLTKKIFIQIDKVYNCYIEKRQKGEDAWGYGAWLEELNGMGVLLVTKWLKEYSIRLGKDKFRRTAVKTLPQKFCWFPKAPEHSCPVCHRNICDPEDHCPRRRAERTFTLSSFEHPRFKPLTAFQREFRSLPKNYIPPIATRLERGAKRVKLEDPLQRQAGDLELSAWLQELEASIHSFHPFQAEREAGWAALLPNDPLGDLECLHVLDFLLLPNFSVELERVQHHCMKPSKPALLNLQSGTSWTGMRGWGKSKG